MPGDNCSIYGCTVSRRSNHKGVAIFKVPSGDTEFEKNWREKLVSIITRDRVIDAALRQRIDARKLYICQHHYREDQILEHATRKTVKPGEIPELNLPIKSFPSSSTSTKPRESADTILQKRLSSLESCTTDIITECYQSFPEFISRIQSLKLLNWELCITSSFVRFSLKDDVHLVPKFEIFVDELLSFTIRFYTWRIPNNHQIYSHYGGSLKNITVSNFIKILQNYYVCPGLSNSLSGSCLEHSVPKIFSLPAQENDAPLCQTKWYRSPSCQVLNILNDVKCSNCIKAEMKETLSLKRRRDNMMLPAKPNAPISMTSPERIKLTLQTYRFENKNLKIEISKMKEEICNKSMPVDVDLGKDLMTIMSENKTNVPPFMKLFWEEQQKYLSSSKTGVRYHPMIIRYCLGLAAKSPAVYDEIRFDEKNNSGFVMLPSRRRLRDYKNYIRPKQGFNKDVIHELENIVQNFSDIEKYCILLMDEMKIQENLVWDKHTGDLIGFVDLGDTELNYATLQKSEEFASHVLVFLVRSVVNPLKFSLANFATNNATSMQLFPLFWKAVGILEDKCELKVVGVTCDGASSNRRMFPMHLGMTRDEDINESVNVTYRIRNVLADDEERFIYMISDGPHLLKTARNCLANSLSGRCTRNMWNNGNYLTWNHISKLFTDDLDCGLHLVPKITNEHIKLTPYSVMNVKLAVQVLSDSVYQALKTYGPPEAIATANFCKMFDNFFDCMNVRNTQEAILKRKEFLKPYESSDDQRFTWLIDTFLKYFSDWEECIADRPGQFSDNAKAKMFISWQTYEGVKITVHSIIDVVKYLLSKGVPYVLTERFCQDPLENYFGRQRSMGHRKDNPSLRDFGYNDNTIRTQKIFRPIAGNCQNDDEQLNKIDVETVPCRKSIRK